MIIVGLSVVYRRTIEGPLDKIGIIKGLAMESPAIMDGSNERGGADARGQDRALGVCGPKYADVREDGHSGNAKRLECVQLAGAIVKRRRAESGSKLHALQTLRARECPRTTTLGRRAYVPE